MRFKQPRQLRRHRVVHDPPENDCPFCTRSFVRRDNLKTHIRTIHPEKVADDPALQNAFVQRGKPALEREHMKDTSTNTAATDAPTESSLLDNDQVPLLPL
ncbi:hypothetical protein BJX62DRAFT_220403 [Aspergillus germanicus]